MTITTLAEFNAANTAHDQEMKLKLARVMKNWDNFHPELQRYAMELLGETDWFKPELGTIQEMKAHHVFGLIKEWRESKGNFPPQKYSINGINVGDALSSARQGLNQSLAALVNAEYKDEWKSKIKTHPEQVFQLIVKWKKENPGFPPLDCIISGINVGESLRRARLGRSHALATMLDNHYGAIWRGENRTSSEEIFNMIMEWKKLNPGFPTRRFVSGNINIGVAIMRARLGKSQFLAKLLDAEYGDEWRQTKRGPKVK